MIGCYRQIALRWKGSRLGDVKMKELIDLGFRRVFKRFTTLDNGSILRDYLMIPSQYSRRNEALSKSCKRKLELEVKSHD